MTALEMLKGLRKLQREEEEAEEEAREAAAKHIWVIDNK